MSYCIQCGEDVGFCDTVKRPMDEYIEAITDGTDLKCYCKKHMPRR